MRDSMDDHSGYSCVFVKTPGGLGSIARGHNAKYQSFAATV